MSTRGAQRRGEGASPAIQENAADWYRRSFASTVHDSQVWKATTRDPEYGYSVPVSKDLVAWFKGTAGVQALSALHRASQVPFCDWGVNLREIGPRVDAPFDQGAWDLARLALLRARWYFEHCEWDLGLEDVLATLTLARHLSYSRLWHSIHFGSMIVGMAVRTSAVYLPIMPSEDRDRLAHRIRTLPRFTSMHEAVLYSERSIDWLLERIREATDINSLRVVLVHLSSPEFADDLLERAPTIARLSALADDSRSIVHAAAVAILQSPAEYAEYYRRQLQQQLTDNPIAAMTGIWYQGDCAMMGNLA